MLRVGGLTGYVRRYTVPSIEEQWQKQQQSCEGTTCQYKNGFKMAVFWDAAPCSPVDRPTDRLSLLPPSSPWRSTRRNIPEDSHLHARHRENLKSHKNGLNYEYNKTRDRKSKGFRNSVLTDWLVHSNSVLTDWLVYSNSVVTDWPVYSSSVLTDWLVHSNSVVTD
jgi:hypothetical protein